MVREMCGGGGGSRAGGLCPVDSRQIEKILFSTKGSFPKNKELPSI